MRNSFLKTLTVLCCVAAGSPAAAQEASLKIGALYSNSSTGHLHLRGIQDAVQAHAHGPNVEVVEIPYLNEREGEELLANWIQEERPDRRLDIILGPTDSGVYVRGAQRQEDFGPRNIIPVISSLVVTPIGNEPDGWFFRTNVDIERRSRAIYDHLNKRWVNSFAVLYADTEFGRRAEAAFREQLRGLQESASSVESVGKLWFW